MCRGPLFDEDALCDALKTAIWVRAPENACFDVHLPPAKECLAGN